MNNSVGEQLRQMRQSKGLSFEQVFEDTRIAPAYLRALEENRWEDLPSQVQGKGFLRLYAGFLGIPVQPLLQEIEIQSQPPQPAEPAVPAPSAPGATPAAPTPAEETPIPSETTSPQPRPALLTALAAWVQSLRSRLPQKIALSKITLPRQPQQQPSVPTSPVDPPELPAPTPQPESPAASVPAVPQHSSAEVFQSIGQSLRLQREKLSLSLADAERFTHVRLHFLEALENGDLSSLPSPVQGRGMLNNYAHFLGLDSEKLLNQFAEGLQVRREEFTARTALPTAKPRPRAAQAPGWRRFLTPDVFIGGAVIFILLSLAIWTTANITARSSERARTALPGVGDVLLFTATPSLTPNETEALTLTVAPPSVLAGEGNPVIPTAQADLELTTPTLPALDDLPLQVYIVARQRAFVRVISDNRIRFNGRVAPGNAYPFSAKEKLELISGDASAIQVFYNQNDLGTLGDSGEVVRLIFSAEGVLTPTPAFTFTPTPTLPPTATLEPSPTVPTATVTPFIP